MRKRSRARVLAHQFLFQHENGALGAHEQYAPRVKAEARDPEITAFALELIDGCLEKWTDVSREVELASRNWPTERMNASDLTVLRLGAYEILHRPDIPPRVSINEAIELAKRFGTKDSGSFVNGVLDKILRKAGGEE